MSALKEMCFNEWFDVFKPLVNPNSDGSGLCIDGFGYMYETYGQDLEEVLKVVEKFGIKLKEQHIWTLIESDDGLFIVDGYHLVNRQGYFITLDPVPTGSSYEIPYDEEDTKT